MASVGEALSETFGRDAEYALSHLSYVGDVSSSLACLPMGDVQDPICGGSPRDEVGNGTLTAGEAHR